jgi:cation diffusion facilitator family transporter
MPQLYPSIYNKVSNPARRVVLTFLASFLSMFVWDGLKSSLTSYMLKFASLQSSLVKHSTPLTRKFFFRNENAADRVTLLGIFVNVVLSISKFWGGITFNSAVLVSDAGHSLSDLFSDFITLWAVQVARLPADEDHPYGHGKFESVGSLFLAMTLLATGASVGSWSYGKMQAVVVAAGGTIFPSAAAVAAMAHSLGTRVPKKPAMLFAALSILSKEWIFRVTRRVGLALNSQIIVANAWHHRSDAFSSFISLFSIGIAIGFPRLLIFDSAAGIFIAGMICLTGAEILLESVKELTDTEDVGLQAELKRAAMTVPGAKGIHSLRTRSVGSGSSLVDLTLFVDPLLSTSAANSIAEKARWLLSTRSTQVKEVFVKTTPMYGDETSAGGGGPACPLLARAQDDPTSIEIEIAEILLAQVPEIEQVPKVTVHFTEGSGSVSVEAFVRLGGDNGAGEEGGEGDEGSSSSSGSSGSSSVEQAREVARRGKAVLEADGRYNAAIYLDLA